MSDSETEAYISLMPGPGWLGKTFSWCVLLVCAFVLWRIAPEIVRILKTQYIEIEKLRQSPEANSLGENGES